MMSLNWEDVPTAICYNHTREPRHSSRGIVPTVSLNQVIYTVKMDEVKKSLQVHAILCVGIWFILFCHKKNEPQAHFPDFNVPISRSSGEMT